MKKCEKCFAYCKGLFLLHQHIIIVIVTVDNPTVDVS